MADLLTIEFSYTEASAMYDLVEFRLLSGSSNPAQVADPEVDEIHALVGALLRLGRALGKDI